MRRRRWIAGLTAAAAVMGLGVVLGIILLVSTKEGTIAIELDDPKANVEVKVDGETVHIAGVGKPLKLTAGEHLLHVSGEDFETLSRSFTVKRGENAMLRVELRPHGQGGVGPPAQRMEQPPGGVVTNSIGMKLVSIPAGEFMMGSASGEPGREPREGPQHKVRISRPFHMGAYEVTQREYERVMGQNPSAHKGPDHPVERVLWTEAAEFCKKLSELPEEKKAGRRYRLPTDAEWEYACRAGTTTRFAFGDALSTLQANFNALAEPDGQVVKPPGPVGKTVKVGSYRPNAWGLYDMHGNVLEWVADWYDENDYANAPTVDPQGPATGRFRLARGGSWWIGVARCRSAWRGGRCQDPLFRDYTAGFRVVCLTE